MSILYFLLFSINAQMCWSYLSVLPLRDYHHIPRQNTQDEEDFGEPLFLTPYLKSNQSSKARELSSVESLLSDEMIFSNAGFFTVDKKYDSNLFFWFFRKQSSDWQKAPLLLWLQGGPGCSSMYGLFEENGPFMVTEDGLKKRNNSWNNDYNIIYIDQPVGSGFSFTKSFYGYIHTQEEVADHLYSALTQFFQLYPELKGNAFYITGEQYAGRYIPAISYKIHKLKEANLTDINLKGLFMISAFTQGLVDGWADFCYEIGIIDFKIKTQLEGIEKMIKENISLGRWKNASRLRDDFLLIIETYSAIDLFDYRKKDAFEPGYYLSVLEEESIRKKIHVGLLRYRECYFKVYDNFSEDISKSVVSWVEELLNHYPVAFVGGQFDILVPYSLVLNVIKKLNWDGTLKYFTAKRKILGGRNLDGYTKSAGNLKDILIRNAGHMVSKDQPQITLDLLNKFVNDEL